MKKLILILILPLLSSTDTPDCSSIKIGTFKLQSADGSVHIITRSHDFQTENVGKTGLTSKFDLKWISECEYILYNRKVIKGRDESEWPFDNDTLHNEIVEVDGNKHKVISRLKKYEMKVAAILEKVEKQ